MRLSFVVLGLASAVAASADPLGTRPSPAAFEASPVGFAPVLQMLAALLLVGAGIKFALPAIMKRFGGGFSTASSNGGTINIEESATFPGGKLYVVEVRGRTLLLGSTANSVTTLADLTVTDFAEALDQEMTPAKDLSSVNDDPMEQLARLQRLGG